MIPLLGGRVSSRVVRRRAHVQGVCSAVLALCLLVLLAASPAHARPLPFRIPEHGAYVGAYVRTDANALGAFNAGAQKQHAYFMRFVSVGGEGLTADESPDMRFVDACAAAGAIPYFTLEPFNATADSLLSPSDVGWIEQFARDVGALDRPVFIRFAHEMNGNWYPWGWGRVAPSVYVQGFRQVSEIFHREAPKAALVWAPSQNWGGTTDDVYSTWYPGDEYVDWVGLTTYQWNYSGLSPIQLIASIQYGDGPEGDFYSTFAVGHSKPMMIAETACGDDDPAYYDNWCYGPNKDEVGTYGTEPGLGAQQWWIRQVYRVGPDSYAMNTRFPLIKAISWFSAQDTGKSGTDFQIGGSDPTSHSTGFGVYGMAIADPYWVSRVPDARVWTVLSSDAVAEWSNLDVTLTLTPGHSDAAEPIRAWYSVGGGSPVLVEHPVVVSTEGTTTIDYFSIDAAGVRETTQSALIRIDKTAPTTVSDAKNSYEDSATVVLSADDGDLSGVAKTEYRIGAAEWQEGTTARVNAAGVHRLEYRSTDRAGNVESPRSVGFTVWSDTKLDLAGPASAPAYGGSARLTATLLRADGTGARDETVLFERWTGGSWTPIGTAAVRPDGTAGVWARGVKTAQRYRASFATRAPYRASTAIISVSPMVRIVRSTSWGTLSRAKTYYATGYVAPKHKVSDPNKVRVRAYKKDAAGTYRYVKSFIAAYAPYSATKTRYRAAVRLPSKGKWMLVARHCADSRNAATDGVADYVTVK